MRLYFLIIILLFLPTVSASVIINEIMYNPISGGYDSEYIELFLDNYVNLTKYIIEDLTADDVLTEVKFVNSSYALIVGNRFNYTNINSTIYVCENIKIAGGLNNDEDVIVIKNPQGNIIDAIHYYFQWGADGNGMSLCKINNLWEECISTPGGENNNYLDNIGYVERVIDGDTFVLTNGERVRLIGIDTPEEGEYYYEEAKDRLRELIGDKQVILENDEEDRDRYNRLLRYVYVDNLFINLVLVEEGFARAYPFELTNRYEEEFAEAEERARENGLGIWSEEENNCDWKVEILLDEYIFLGSENVNWTVKVSKNNGEKTNVSVRGYVKDILSNWKMDYRPWTNESITGYRNKDYTLNLRENKFYSIFFNITELNCNDVNLINNFDQRFIMILPLGLNQDYTKLRINEFLPDPRGYDDAKIPDGEWIELHNSGDFNIDIEGLTLNDNYGNGLEISNVNILQNTTIIQPNDYLNVYRNNDGRLELNNEGFEKIKLLYKNITIDEVSYSHTKEGLSWSKVNDIWIQTIPTPGQENYIEEPDYSSYLDIDEVYLGNNDKAKFGDSLRVRIVVYKGDTLKYNLDLYVVDENNKQISKRSEINLEDTFTNYTLIVPIQIEPNCNKKYFDGIYKIILKGLDEIDTKEIEIEGITESLCEEIKVEEKTSSEKVSSSQNTKNLEFGNETSKESITSSVVYQSSDVKARNFGIYFFCSVLLILIIYLTFKKSL